MPGRARTYRCTASLLSLVLVLGIAAPLIECCLAAGAVPLLAHTEHAMPAPSTEMPADCHGGDDAPEPVEDCCALTGATKNAPTQEAIPSVAKAGSNYALSASAVGDAPAPRPLANSKVPPSVQELAPRTHVYLLVSSLLI